MTSARSFKRAIDCAMRTEVAPHLARGRPNLVVFDEDIGLETLAADPRGADRPRAAATRRARRASGQASPCATLATLSAVDDGYARALTYLERGVSRSSRASSAASFVAATDKFVRDVHGDDGSRGATLSACT